MCETFGEEQSEEVVEQRCASPGAKSVTPGLAFAPRVMVAPHCWVAGLLWPSGVENSTVKRT